MTDEEYLMLGRSIVTNLEKLMSGEHFGIAVILPIATNDGRGIAEIEIKMPRAMRVTFRTDEPGYTWVPSSAAYVRNDFVYREKAKEQRLAEQRSKAIVVYGGKREDLGSQEYPNGAWRFHEDKNGYPWDITHKARLEGIEEIKI